MFFSGQDFFLREMLTASNCNPSSAQGSSTTCSPTAKMLPYLLLLCRSSISWLPRSVLSWSATFLTRATLCGRRSLKPVSVTYPSAFKLPSPTRFTLCLFVANEVRKDYVVLLAANSGIADHFGLRQHVFAIVQPELLRTKYEMGVTVYDKVRLVLPISSKEDLLLIVFGKLVSIFTIA